jgi:hypothetical protein
MPKFRSWPAPVALAALTAPVVGASSACDDTIDIANAAPRLTWVLVAPVDEGTATLHFWVFDVEGDSVDVTARWVARDGRDGPVDQVAPAFPWTGRVTRDALLDPNGQEQRIAWDLAAIPSDIEVQLVFDIDDDPTDSRPADRWTSSFFDPRTGFEPAVRWEIVGAD